MTHEVDSPAPPRFWRSRQALGLVVMAAVAAVFLLSEHRAHFLGVLPFALVLVCPLMHLFMHRGHRHHRHADGTTHHGATDGDCAPGDPR